MAESLGKAVLELGVEMKELDRDMSTAKSKLTDFGNTRVPKPNLDANTGPAMRKITDLKVRLAAIRDERVDVNVNVDRARSSQC